MTRRVYLAGPMPNDPSLPEAALAHWRAGVLKRWKLGHQQCFKDVELFCPEFLGRNHDSYNATVHEDFLALRSCVAVFAYIDGIERQGTFAEMGFAAALGLPITAVFNQAYEGPTFLDALCQESVWGEISMDDLAEVACALIALSLAARDRGVGEVEAIRRDSQTVEDIQQRLYSQQREESLVKEDP